jgi:hypothetical protein
MYASTHVRFDRKGDKVTPLRVTKQWVMGPGKSEAKKFIPVRSTVVGFGRISHGPEEWQSSKEKPMDRSAMIAAGLIRPLGSGEPCLELDDPAGWSLAVLNNPLPPWSDPYEIGTEE